MGNDKNDFCHYFFINKKYKTLKYNLLTLF